MSTPECAINMADTTWVLISTVLVLTMMPALAFFEAGLLRSRNALSIITQVMAGMVVLSLMWFIIGYTLSFGGDVGSFIGNFDHIFFIDVSFYECNRHASTIPAACFAIFFMMFAAITPLLMTGGYAERMTWQASLLLSVLFEILVFYPLAHQVWGGGWLAQIGVRDFAGGIVIHTTAGVGSFVCALYLGRRCDFEHYHGEFPPSNLPLAALGAGLLWSGWFGFNGGSALTSGGVAVSAIVSTQIACSSAATAWMICTLILNGRPSTIGLMNGALAGLAGVTPASGYIDAPTSIVLGMVLGLCAFGSVKLLKGRLLIDDALDVSSVHGVTGMVGSLAVGLVARNSINPSCPDGLFFGNPRQFGVQLLGVAYAACYSGLVTWGLLKFIERVLGKIRHDDEQQTIGLDWVEYREIAYHDLHVLDESSAGRSLAKHLPDGLPSSDMYMRAHASHLAPSPSNDINNDDDDDGESGAGVSSAYPSPAGAEIPLVERVVEKGGEFQDEEEEEEEQELEDFGPTKTGGLAIHGGKHKHEDDDQL